MNQVSRKKLSMFYIEKSLEMNWNALTNHLYWHHILPLWTLWVRMLSREGFHRSPNQAVKRKKWGLMPVLAETLEVELNETDFRKQRTLERYSISRISLSVKPFCVDGLLFRISSCSAYSISSQQALSKGWVWWLWLEEKNLTRKPD